MTGLFAKLPPTPAKKRYVFKATGNPTLIQHKFELKCCTKLILLFSDSLSLVFIVNTILYLKMAQKSYYGSCGNYLRGSFIFFLKWVLSNGAFFSDRISRISLQQNFSYFASHVLSSSSNGDSVSGRRKMNYKIVLGPLL